MTSTVFYEGLRKQKLSRRRVLLQRLVLIPYSIPAAFLLGCVVVAMPVPGSVIVAVFLPLGYLWLPQKILPCHRTFHFGNYVVQGSRKHKTSGGANLTRIYAVKLC